MGLFFAANFIYITFVSAVFIGAGAARLHPAAGERARRQTVPNKAANLASLLAPDLRWHEPALKHLQVCRACRAGAAMGLTMRPGVRLRWLDSMRLNMGAALNRPSELPDGTLQ